MDPRGTRRVTPGSMRNRTRALRLNAVWLSVGCAKAKTIEPAFRSVKVTFRFRATTRLPETGDMVQRGRRLPHPSQPGLLFAPGCRNEGWIPSAESREFRHKRMAAARPIGVRCLCRCTPGGPIPACRECRLCPNRDRQLSFVPISLEQSVADAADREQSSALPPCSYAALKEDAQGGPASMPKVLYLPGPASTERRWFH